MGETRKSMGGCEIYRISMPFSYMMQHGHQCGWAFYEDIYNEYKVVGPKYWKGFVESADIFVFPRLFVPDKAKEEVTWAIQYLFDQIRKAGKRVVYELDDDYTNEFRDVIGGDAIVAARATDGITASTDVLAKRMKKLTGRPTHVLPNMIDMELWGDAGEPKYKDELGAKILIGLTGSSTHEHDWIVLKNVLPYIIDKYPHVHLLVGGYNPDYLLGLENTTYLPGVNYATYSRLVRNFDLVLAPVNPFDGFNDFKSPIKAIEGMAARRSVDGKPAGGAVIATNNLVYRTAVRHGKTGLLVEHTPDAWAEAIERTITDTAMRKRLQIAGHTWVQRKHSIARHWTKWVSAYQKILNAPANPVELGSIVDKGVVS